MAYTTIDNSEAAFQTLKVSSSVSLNDRIKLKLVQPDDDDSSYAVFAQLQVEKG